MARENGENERMAQSSQPNTRASCPGNVKERKEGRGEGSQGDERGVATSKTKQRDISEKRVEKAYLF